MRSGGEEVERNKVYGMTSEEILDYFYDKSFINAKKIDGRPPLTRKDLGAEN